MTHPILDPIGSAFRERRLGLELSMRDVEAESARLAATNPDLYAPISRNSIAELEHDGLKRLRTMDHRTVRGIIVLLFKDMAAFVATTGYDPNLSATNEVPLQRIPMWVEGETVVPHLMMQDTTNRRTTLRAHPRGLYAVEVTTDMLIPVVYPGSVVQVAPSPQAAPGQLCLLHRRGKLELAYAAPDNRFATMQGKNTFALGRGDAVIGIVVSNEPHIPEAYFAGTEVGRTG